MKIPQKIFDDLYIYDTLDIKLLLDRVILELKKRELPHHANN